MSAETVFDHHINIVERIEYLENGVRVHLTDGTVEEGDIVIGSDGVHSKVKQQMFEWADKSAPGTFSEADKNAVYTDFAGIFGVSETNDAWGLGPGDTHVVLDHNHTKLMFTQPGQTMWAIIFKQPHSSPPKPLDTSPENVEKVAQSYKDSNFTDKLKFSELWATNSRHGYLNIEEGLQPKWHAGRFVLVGDSAHKVRQPRHDVEKLPY